MATEVGTGGDITAWLTWAGSTPTTASATTTEAWYAWNTTATTTTTWHFKQNDLVPTEADLRTRREREARERRDREEREQRRRRKAEEAREAHKRAEALLLEHLDEEQKETLSRQERFRVRGSKGGVYDICKGSVYQYETLDADPLHPFASVCIHASNVPEADNMLAKKLMVETDEDEFRRIGNIARY